MTRLVRRAWPWLAIGALITIIVGAARTADLTFVPGAAEDLLVRKLGHAGVYALLVILVQVALDPRRAGSQPDVSRHHGSRMATARGLLRPWLLPLAAATLVALSDELLQSVSVGREGKVADLATDITGAIAGLVLMRSWRIQRRRGRRWISPVRPTAPLPRAPATRRSDGGA